MKRQTWERRRFLRTRVRMMRGADLRTAAPCLRTSRSTSKATGKRYRKCRPDGAVSAVYNPVVRAANLLPLQPKRRKNNVDAKIRAGLMSAVVALGVALSG